MPIDYKVLRNYHNYLDCKWVSQTFSPAEEEEEERKEKEERKEEKEEESVQAHSF